MRVRFSRLASQDLLDIVRIIAAAMDLERALSRD